MKECHSKFLTRVLRLMFKCVGAKYSIKFTKNDNWYKCYSWTVREEERFKIWLTQEIRKEFRVNKRSAKNDADFFLLNYGWVHRVEEC